MENQRHRMGSLRMGWLMLVGCLLPLGILALLFLFDVPLSTVAVGALILICPLSHLFLMGYMGHGQGDSKDGDL